MYFAIGVEPTKLIACTSGLVSSSSTATLSPWTTLKTPSGNPAFLKRSATSIDADGSRSDGFRMNVLPQTMATGNIHIGTITGKLNGVMPATTPSGCRSEWLSTLVPTFSVISPLSSCGAPVANSTTSTPRVTSPMASSCTLPCSLVMSAASASWFCSQSSRNFAMMRARRSGGVAAHFGNAAFAAAMAFATSSWLASGTRAFRVPSAGLNTSLNRPLVPDTRCPLM